METFDKLKRRSTVLLKQAQKKVPELPKDVKLPRKLPSLPLSQLRQKLTKSDGAPNAVRATWERVDVPSLPRSSHSLDVVGGCAYIFGGEVAPQQLAANDTHIVRLPFSSAGADYHAVAAKAAPLPELMPEPVASTAAADAREQDAVEEATPSTGLLDEVPLEEGSSSTDKGKGIATTPDRGMLGDVPAPRAGHATAVIGSRIFLFGGRGGPNMEPLQEAGRVWVYDTRSHAWSYLDPVPAVKGGAIVPHPAPRSDHSATATDRPRPAPVGTTPPQVQSKQTWRQWALGGIDTSMTGIPQDPVVGYVAEAAVDVDTEGYGTLIVHAGRLANGDRASDLWAFDVRARTWTEWPAAPGPQRSGTATCISKSRLYRFGGFDGTAQLGAQLDIIPLEVEAFGEAYAGDEVAVHARTGWQTVTQTGPEQDDAPTPMEEPAPWPAPRSCSSLQALSVGGGKEHLVLCMGEREGSDSIHGTTVSSDVWTFQVPPQGMSAASLGAAVSQALGRKTKEGTWEKLRTGPYDMESSDSVPSGRARFASAPMADVEEGGLFIWGGQGADGASLGDGWILRIVG